MSQPRAKARPLVDRAAMLIVATLVVAGCGLSFFGSLAAPTGVTATTNRTDLIELSWADVKGADVYYVYRSLSSDGLFGIDGEYGLVPYRTVRETTLLDVDVDPTSYFYRVSAGRLSTGDESEMSDVAEGARLAEAIGWQDAAVIVPWVVYNYYGDRPHDAHCSSICADSRKSSWRNRDDQTN